MDIVGTGPRIIPLPFVPKSIGHTGVTRVLLQQSLLLDLRRGSRRDDVALDLGAFCRSTFVQGIGRGRDLYRFHQINSIIRSSVYKKVLE